jgi:hypothetical protein
MGSLSWVHSLCRPRETFLVKHNTWTWWVIAERIAEFIAELVAYLIVEELVGWICDGSHVGPSVHTLRDQVQSSLDNQPLGKVI